ncbi:MAG: periplasmic heavy metal sensor [Bacteroidota bacterium]
MSWIKNNKTTTILLVVLALMNVGLMAILLLGPPPPPKPEHMARRMIHELALNDSQEQTFIAKEQDHFSKTKALMDSIRLLRNELVAQIDQAPAQKNELAQEIGRLEGAVVLRVSQHFDDLAEDLDEAQQKKLKQLFERRFFKPRIPGRGRPKR